MDGREFTVKLVVELARMTTGELISPHQAGVWAASLALQAADLPDDDPCIMHPIWGHDRELTGFRVIGGKPALAVVR